MFTLMYPAKIIFGRGVLEQLGPEVKRWGKKALLVTGKSAIGKSGILDKVAAVMESARVEFSLFDRVEHDPSLKTVDEGVKFLRKEKCGIVVGLGGGSTLDVAKAIASLARQPGTVWEYHNGQEIKKEGLPFMALPTTAGTGAEITNNSVLTDRNKVIKKSIRSPLMIAKVALVDPELTLSLPAQITAYTGMDAFTQALESYVSEASNPVSDGFALRAVEIIYRSLPEAVQDGGNKEVRERMALGSLLSGMAFSNSGLGAVHGLAHPIGARFNVPHGLACAVLLPYIIEFNLRAKPDKFKQIAEKTGIEKVKDLPSSIRKLLEEVNLPVNFKSYQISEADFSAIIAASRSNSMSKNPREVSDEDLREILKLVI